MIQLVVHGEYLYVNQSKNFTHLLITNIYFFG